MLDYQDRQAGAVQNTLVELPQQMHQDSDDNNCREDDAAGRHLYYHINNYGYCIDIYSDGHRNGHCELLRTGQVASLLFVASSGRLVRDLLTKMSGFRSHRRIRQRQ